MWSRFKSAEFIYGTNWHKYMLDIMSPAISMEADMIFIFVMALVTGMAMFSYLYNSRACNMIHAMPVTRRQLFSTNVLTGLLFMWIPQIVKYIMSFVICISYGNTKVVHIGINLLATMGISFFMYSLVCLCAMITGQLVSVAVMYAVVNLLYGGAVIAIANVLTYVSYGLSYMEFVRKISATWFAPMLQLLNRVGFHPTMKNAGDDYYCIKYTFRGTNTIVVYVIAAAVIYFISYKIYKHRDLENAGSFIAIPKLKPVFRWGLGSLGGLILSIVAASLLLGLRISIGVPEL
jgi:ABC-2 type transport system permease protein